MAKTKVEVIFGVVDGKPRGSTLSIEERSADYFESIGYVKKVAEEKPKPKSKPKAQPKKKPSTSTKTDEDK